MKTVLVTGGSRGIGRAIVEEFSAADYAVGFTYANSRQASMDLAACLNAQGRSVRAYEADARDFARAAQVVAQVRSDLGEIDVLVNNAGIKRDGVLTMMDVDSWRDVIDTNLGGVFNYTRALMRDMIRRGGSVINMTSVSGQVGIAGQTSYSASKAGVVGFTKSLAREVARFNVRVNAIAPGYIETEMTASMDEAMRKKAYAEIPMRRPGCGRDVARLALFLASDGAGYATGQVWTLDGGLT